jgi:hypothetical protein
MVSHPVRVPALTLQARQGDAEAYATRLETYRATLISFASLHILDDNDAIAEYVAAALARAAQSQRTWLHSKMPLDEWLVVRLKDRLLDAGVPLKLAGAELFRVGIDAAAPGLGLRAAAIIMMLTAMQLQPASIANILDTDIEEVRAATKAYAQARARREQT